MEIDKELDQIINELYAKKDWMDDDDYKEYLAALVNEKGTKEEFKKILYKDIEIGVRNGHSPEKQLSIVKMLLEQVKEGN